MILVQKFIISFFHLQIKENFENINNQHKSQVLFQFDIFFVNIIFYYEIRKMI